MCYLQYWKKNDNIYNEYRGCKTWNFKKVLKRYYEDNDKMLQKRRDKCASFEDLDDRLKAWEGNAAINDSENK